MRTFYEDDRIVLYCGDCRDFVAPEEAVTIADVPYQQTSLAWATICDRRIPSVVARRPLRGRGRGAG